MVLRGWWKQPNDESTELARAEKPENRHGQDDDQINEDAENAGKKAKRYSNQGRSRLLQCRGQRAGDGLNCLPQVALGLQSLPQVVKILLQLRLIVGEVMCQRAYLADQWVDEQPGKPAQNDNNDQEDEKRPYGARNMISFQPYHHGPNRLPNDHGQQQQNERPERFVNDDDAGKDRYHQHRRQPDGALGDADRSNPQGRGRKTASCRTVPQLRASVPGVIPI